MIIILIGMSLFFVAIGFIVTENNAEYLLAGYNTMSEEERKKFDIKNYIPHFRRFHLFLGISFLVIGLLLHYLIGQEVSGIFLAAYPILAYIYFIGSSHKFSKNGNSKRNKVAVLVMVAALVFVGFIFSQGLKEDKLLIENNAITLTGNYGEVLTVDEIARIELVESLPKITMKTNGFALGSKYKGYFKTQEGQIVKLILNSDAKPYVLFTKKSGERIYFSTKEKSNQILYNDLKKALPALFRS
jgi:Kef-type K+ transport system membrane component KefB